MDFPNAHLGKTMGICLHLIKGIMICCDLLKGIVRTGKLLT
uniref:Uncharacterized protein n=1 Tax=Rhizophora mucronata TaxID=61149 RepID=A0A2P2QTC6_RHIMU